jgi:hypothetical protein
MRYLLDQDGYERLKPATEVLARDAAIDELRKALLKAKKYKCIHEEPRSHFDNSYCDNCPCQKLTNKLVCDLRKNFSQ